MSWTRDSTVGAEPSSRSDWPVCGSASQIRMPNPPSSGWQKGGKGDVAIEVQGLEHPALGLQAGGGGWIVDGDQHGGASRRPRPWMARGAAACAGQDLVDGQDAIAGLNLAQADQPRGSLMPARIRPAWARTTASYWPARTLFTRVSTLPRISAKCSRTDGCELVLPAKAAGADAGTEGQVVEGYPGGGHEDVSHRARGGTQRMSRAGGVGRADPRGMDRQIDAPGTPASPAP